MSNRVDPYLLVDLAARAESVAMRKILMLTQLKDLDTVGLVDVFCAAKERYCADQARHLPIVLALCEELPVDRLYGDGSRKVLSQISLDLFFQADISCRSSALRFLTRIHTGRILPVIEACFTLASQRKCLTDDEAAALYVYVHAHAGHDVDAVVSDVLEGYRHHRGSISAQRLLADIQRYAKLVRLETLSGPTIRKELFRDILNSHKRLNVICYWRERPAVARRQ